VLLIVAEGKIDGPKYLHFIEDVVMPASEHDLIFMQANTQSPDFKPN
jgi:hypothetical protein